MHSTVISQTQTRVEAPPTALHHDTFAVSLKWVVA